MTVLMIFLGLYLAMRHHDRKPMTVSEIVSGLDCSGHRRIQEEFERLQES